MKIGCVCGRGVFYDGGGAQLGKGHLLPSTEEEEVERVERVSRTLKALGIPDPGSTHIQTIADIVAASGSLVLECQACGRVHCFFQDGSVVRLRPEADGQRRLLWPAPASEPAKS